MDLQLKACIVCSGGDKNCRWDQSISTSELKAFVSFVVSGAISTNEHKSEKHLFSSLVVYKLDWSVSHIWSGWGYSEEPSCVSDESLFTNDESVSLSQWEVDAVVQPGRRAWKRVCTGNRERTSEGRIVRFSMMGCWLFILPSCLSDCSRWLWKGIMKALLVTRVRPTRS